MSSLSFQTDRLTQHSKSIQHAANATACHSSSSGPFTRALLHTPLGDLMRDADASELGLFYLAPPSVDSAIDLNSASAVERVRFSATTPLKKSKNQEARPEVYAQAALKYIDRYDHIRPMPRAHDQVQAILGRLVAVRKSVSALSEKLRQAQETDMPLPKAGIELEEQKIAALQERITSLNLRKNLAQHRQEQSRSPSPMNGGTPPPVRPSHQEVDGPSSVIPAAKTLRFTDNMLLDEDMDIGNTSVASFGSPLPRLKTHSIGMSYALPDSDFEQDSGDRDLGPSAHAPPEEVLETELDGLDDQPPNREPTSRTAKEETASTPSTRRIKVTTEVERIVMKIWQTPTDLLAPFNNDQTPPRSIPHVKEFITHLQSVSALPPPPNSPSAPSLSSVASTLQSEPTFQQVLTAHLLLALLSSDSYSLPMNDVKGLLTSKAIAAGAAASQSPIRVLFACVGKRILKIERGGGEQMVKFDF
ncbi:hypothetical protein BDN72DRAFT_509829 [Pluteus cervinus]|uniref:Uncharacterized protein n=1 Tax=Pluteus cervinus TaxID=181527 RepID=A0ACD3BCJ4_9AGAR|nr:hypothetical protein BDN72DRAFT_509829 [Pluteus cervinus]